MRISESRIRQIIREEARRVLREGSPAGMGESPRQKLIDYLEKNGGDELVSAVLDEIDHALDRATDRDEPPTSEDVTFNLSDAIINMIPADDENEWHEMLDAVLKDEFEPDDGDYESTRETERDLGHWSNFIPPRGSNR
jgi:hypothetical protein